MMLQIEGLGGSSQQPAPPDTAGGLAELTGAVDRITEIRSWSDVLDVAGGFQVQLLTFAGKLLVGFVVLVVFIVLYRVVSGALRRLFTRYHIGEDAADLLLIALKFVVLGFGLVVALDQVGFNVTGLLAGLGVMGLALGFAARDTLANFIAGVTILWDRPFRVGDRVEIDGEFGQVKKITLRSTRIHTNQNMVVIIPNQSVMNNKIINHTMQASLRLDVPFGIAYKEDIRVAREIVLGIVSDDDRLRGRPAPQVVVTDLADSSVDMALRVWIRNPHQEIPLELELRERIKLALDEAGISIPFPHLSLYVEEMPGKPPPEEERS